MISGNAIVGQSGGPTSVINATLAGVIDECKRSTKIKKIYGMNYAIEGFMQEKIFDLSKETKENLEQLATTPGSALGSCRYKVQDKDFPLILEMFKKYDIRFFFLIGGNDTMDTIHRVEKYCHSQGYELYGIGIPKTVDNDLFGTDYTPGYASAARFNAYCMLNAGVLARDMKKVDQFMIYQSIGRDAGWLTAATALAKTKDPESAPHILLLPEIRFDTKKFLAKVDEVYKKFGWVSIACGEGVLYKDGTPLSAGDKKDKFGNTELGAMGGGSVGLAVHRIITEAHPTWRGEFQITESLPMSAAHLCTELDFKEAIMLGNAAVLAAVNGVTGKMVSLERKKGKKYATNLNLVDLSTVAVRAKPMPHHFISKDGFYITQAFLDYAKPVVGEMPKYFRLKGKPAKPSITKKKK